MVDSSAPTLDDFYDTCRAVPRMRDAVHLPKELFQRRIGLSAKRRRLHVMQLRLLFRWRLARRIDDREVEMRIGVFRIRRDGVEHLFLGCFLPAFLARGNTQIIMCRRAL